MSLLPGSLAQVNLHAQLTAARAKSSGDTAHTNLGDIFAEVKQTGDSVAGRDFHSSTFQLNLSTLDGIRRAASFCQCQNGSG